MDPSLITTLVQLGGGFVLAAIILVLHREALKSFREELTEERRACSESQHMDRKVFEARWSQLLRDSDESHQDHMSEFALIKTDLKLVLMRIQDFLQKKDEK